MHQRCLLLLAERCGRCPLAIVAQGIKQRLPAEGLLVAEARSISDLPRSRCATRKVASRGAVVVVSQRAVDPALCALAVLPISAPFASVASIRAPGICRVGSRSTSAVLAALIALRWISVTPTSWTLAHTEGHSPT